MTWSTDMLWYKAWMETRWRFLIGLGLLVCSTIATVLAYPYLMKLLGVPTDFNIGGELGRRLAEAVAISRQYRGYVWSQWFGQGMANMWTVCAVLIGTGGLLSQASGGGTLFTLSLPATRNRLVGVRAATGLAELAVLAFVPALLVPLFSPAAGQSYAVGDALIHATCLFFAGGVFFSLAVLLSTVFSDLWRPLLVVFCVAVALVALDALVPRLPVSLFRVMRGEDFFRSGSVPWVGLLGSTALSAALLYGAARNVARTDF